MNEDRSSDHLVLGGLLFLVFSLVVALVFVYTRAADVADVTTTTYVANVDPVVESVNVAYALGGAHIASSSDGIVISVGATKSIVVYGSVKDENGSQLDGINANGDISNVRMTLYRSGATNGANCTLDNNDCYKETNCTIDSLYAGGDGATQAQYSCTVNLEFYADSTKAGGAYPGETWKAAVTVTDLNSGTDIRTADTAVAATLGFAAPAAISYGPHGLGATTTATTRVITAIEQRGNAFMDIEVSGGNMECSDIGYIPVANQKWSLFSVGHSDTASSTALATSSAQTNINVGYREDEGTPLSANLYWNIKIPDTGVRGTCAGTNTFTVLSG